MFRTIKLIRLHAKCDVILQLIQESNNRVREANSDLFTYDGIKNEWHPFKISYSRHDFTDKIEKYENVSAWLVTRYERVIIELEAEKEKRAPKKLLTTSENY